MFAGGAMEGLVVDLCGPATPAKRANLAAECYLIADAMMAARRPSIPNPKRSKRKA